MKELVIRLSDEVYEDLTKYGQPLPSGNRFHDAIMSAVANGIQLPKGLARTGINEIDIFNRAYQQGLNDAWECARKIDSDRDIENYVFGKDLEKDYDDVSASEAMEKIKEYEEKKNQTFKVGDEVYVFGSKRNAVITSLICDGNGKLANIIFPDGNTACREVCNFRKTGRHFQQIEDVLKEMEET